MNPRNMLLVPWERNFCCRLPTPSWWSLRISLPSPTLRRESQPSAPADSEGVCSLQPRQIETLDNVSYLTYRLDVSAGPPKRDPPSGCSESVVAAVLNTLGRTLGGYERFRTHASAPSPDGESRRRGQVAPEGPRSAREHRRRPGPRRGHRISPRRFPARLCYRIP